MSKKGTLLEIVGTAGFYATIWGGFIGTCLASWLSRGGCYVSPIDHAIICRNY